MCSTVQIGKKRTHLDNQGKLASAFGMKVKDLPLAGVPGDYDKSCLRSNGCLCPIDIEKLAEARGYSCVYDGAMGYVLERAVDAGEGKGE